MGLLRAAVRDLVAEALWRAQVTRPRDAERLTILTFHRVLPETERRDYPHPGLAVTPDEFAWLLDFFGERFELRTVSEAHARFVAGERVGRPWGAVSFDDGQWDNFAHAAPLLEARGLRGSFYIPTADIGTEALLWHDQLGFALQAAARRRVPLPAPPAGSGVAPAPADYAVGPTSQWAKTLPPAVRRQWLDRLRQDAGEPAPAWARLMRWDEVIELHRRGHEIGSHSVSHALLTQLDDDALRRELLQSRETLESQLGAQVSSFCYPNGSCDARVQAATRDAGYALAVTTRWGANRRAADPWALQRCDVASQHLRDVRGRLSRARVALRISGLQPNLR